MLAKKVRRLLQSEVSHPYRHHHRHRGAPRQQLSKAFTFISGRHMTPSGCQCLITLAEVGRSGPRTTTTVLRRRRAVVPGVRPGELLRARALAYDALATAAGDGVVNKGLSLPSHIQTLTLQERPRLNAQSSDGNASPPASYLVAAPRRPLPCAAASSFAKCQLCPWMAVGAELSGSTKAEVVREAVDAVAHDALMGDLVVKFMEPFTVPVHQHFLQEVELTFIRERPARDSGESVVGSARRLPVHADAAEEARGRSAGALGHFALASHPSRLPIVAAPTDATRSGNTSKRMEKVPLPATARVTRAAAGASSASLIDRCPLATLEQKRLAISLTRWAAQLPAAMRDAIDSVYIAQPTLTVKQAEGSASANNVRPWTSSLLVTLAMHKDVEGWGPQSPLCGPSHPPDVLSVEEQRLVDAVLEAAPLIQRLSMHVLFTPRRSSEETKNEDNYDTQLRQKDASMGKMDCLYPVTARGIAVPDLLKRHAVAEEHRPPKEFGPPREITCYCPPLNSSEEGGERAEQVCLPGLHSSVLWLGLALSSAPSSPSPRSFRGAMKLGRELHKGDDPVGADSRDRKYRGDGGKALVDTTPALPALSLAPLMPFWRHRNSLDATCSILFSVLLTDAGAREVRVLPPTLAALRLNAGAAPATVLLAQAVAGVACGLATKLTSAVDGTPGKATSDIPSPAVPTAIVSVLGDADSDVAALLDCLAAPHGKSMEEVRLLLVQCSVDMKAALLQDALAAVAKTVRREGTTTITDVEAGVVDVDPLSAACIAYAAVTLRPSELRAG